jgi:hypothetical protein
MFLYSGVSAGGTSERLSISRAWAKSWENVIEETPSRSEPTTVSQTTSRRTA